MGSPRDLDVRITSPTSAYATWTGIPDTRQEVRGKLLGYKVLTLITLFLISCHYPEGMIDKSFSKSIQKRLCVLGMKSESMTR